LGLGLRLGLGLEFRRIGTEATCAAVSRRDGSGKVTDKMAHTDDSVEVRAMSVGATLKLTPTYVHHNKMWQTCWVSSSSSTYLFVNKQ